MVDNYKDMDSYQEWIQIMMSLTAIQIEVFSTEQRADQQIDMQYWRWLQL